MGIRRLLCRHHGCELEIPLYHPHCFLNLDHAMFDCGGVAFKETGFHGSSETVKVREFKLHNLCVVIQSAHEFWGGFMLDLLDPIIDFFWELYRADKRPEARRLTIGCFLVVLLIVILICVIAARSV